MVDIGGGATNLLISQAGAIRHTAVLPVGGGHLTKDIAAGLRTPVAEAEKLKQRHGCAAPAAVARDETIEVPVQVNGKVRARLSVSQDIDESEIRELALADEKVANHTAGKELVKFIYVPKRMLTLVVKG